MQGDGDLVAEACHGLIDGVVDHLPNEMVETRQTCRADVHAGSTANGVETFQHLNVLGTVGAGGLSGGAFGGVAGGVYRHALPPWWGRRERHE